MSNSIEIIRVIVEEGNLYELHSEDGSIICYDCIVRCTDIEGKVYHHKKLFKGSFVDEEGFYRPNRNCRPAAERLAERVNEVKFINPVHWDYIGLEECEEARLARLEAEWSDNSDHFC